MSTVSTQTDIDGFAADGFGYLANQMGSADDPRANRLVAALRSCVGGG